MVQLKSFFNINPSTDFKLKTKGAPVQTYFIKKNERTPEFKSYSISLQGEASQRKTSYLLSFGSKNTACLSNHSMLPVAVIQNKALASFFGQCDPEIILQDVNSLQIHAEMKAPSLISDIKEKCRLNIRVTEGEKTQESALYWVQEGGVYWYLKSSSGQILAFASKETNSEKAILLFYHMMPKQLLELLISSITFILFK